jgi:hypothetical protein
VASPGFQVSHRKQKIQCTVAVRTKTVCAAALGTYHLFSRGPRSDATAGRIPKTLP